MQPSGKPVVADIKMFAAIPPILIKNSYSAGVQYHSIHKNTTETDGTYISKGWVQSLHASSLFIIIMCTYMLIIIHAHA